MNRFIGKFFTIALMIGSMMLTSCLKEQDDNGVRQGYGYVTILNDDVLGSQGFMDSGGYLKFESSTASKLKDVERAFVVVQYNIKDYIEKPDGSFVVSNATLSAADVLPVDRPMYLKEAEEQKVLAPDSCSSILKVSGVWAKKGYLTTDVVTYFGVVNGKSVNPKVSYVVLNNENTEDNTLNLQFCFNNNVNNNSKSLSTGESIRSLDISGLKSVVTGNDSVTVNITFKDIKDPVMIKMGRTDFDKPTMALF